MIRPSSLEQWLINPSTTGHNPNRRPRTARDRLLRTTGKTNTSLVIVRAVSNDGSVIARRACQGTAVADLLLDVADDGSFGALRDGQNIADGEGGFLAAVDEGTSVEAFGCDESFFAEFVPVGIAENYACKGGAAVDFM